LVGKKYPGTVFFRDAVNGLWSGLSGLGYGKHKSYITTTSSREKSVDSFLGNFTNSILKLVEEQARPL